MKITKVYDANVYMNNGSTHGQASEVTCPTIGAVMTDYKALGMVGTAEFFNGFDKMEASVKWTYPSNEVKKTCANFRKVVDLMVRSNKVEFDSSGVQSEQPVVVYMRGFPKTHEGGAYKTKEDTEVNTTFSINYYKEEVDGEVLVELDVLNNIYRVGGEDMLATMRENLGI